MKRKKAVISHILFTSLILLLLLGNLNISSGATVTIKNIQDISVKVYQGDPYSLPDKVTALMSNNGKKPVPITWSKTTADTSKVGTFTYLGSVSGYAKKVSLKIIVAEPFLTDILQPYSFSGGILDTASHFVTPNVTVKLGNDVYTKTIVADCNSNFDWAVTYNLKGNYKLLQLSVVMLFNNSDFKVIADDNVIWSETLKGNDLPKDIEVDITGVKKLQFFGQGNWYILNPKIYRSSKSNQIIQTNTDAGQQNIDSTQRGNTIGNSVNLGCAAFTDGWIYYIKYGGGICKTRQNSDDTNTIYSGDAYDLNVVNGWIYFSSSNDHTIKKIKVDGTSLTKVIDKYLHSMNVVGNYLYGIYEDPQSENKYSVIKCKLDGSEWTQLSRENSKYYNLCVDNGWVYYSTETKINDDQYRYEIFRMKTDGSNNGKIGDGSHFLVDGQWVYYVDDTTKTLFKMKTDGSNKIQVISDECFCFNMSGDWIYYSVGAQGDIYKILKNGTNKTIVHKYVTAFLLPNIADNWIYYFMNKYRVSLDGMIHQELGVN